MVKIVNTSYSGHVDSFLTVRVEVRGLIKKSGPKKNSFFYM